MRVSRDLKFVRINARLSAEEHRPLRKFVHVHKCTVTDALRIAIRNLDNIEVGNGGEEPKSDTAVNE